MTGQREGESRSHNAVDGIESHCVHLLADLARGIKRVNHIEGAVCQIQLHEPIVGRAGVLQHLQRERPLIASERCHSPNGTNACNKEARHQPQAGGVTRCHRRR
eukprot:5772945-Prymnesium_polylepis.1